MIIELLAIVIKGVIKSAFTLMQVTIAFMPLILIILYLIFLR